MVPNDRAERVSRLPLLIMAAVIAMAALLTIALVASRDPESYPEGSPEAALQRFVSAALDDDEDAAVTLLTEEMNARCTAAMQEDVYGWSWSGDGVQADLVDIEIDGERADATVRFREGNSGDPFDSSSWDFERRFTLVRIDGTWLVERAGWPYEFEDCTRGDN